MCSNLGRISAESWPNLGRISAESRPNLGRTRPRQTYYKYELFTPTALTGAHNLAALTFKGNVSILLARGPPA